MALSGTPAEVAVAIAGGGLGGLALAIGLQRVGIDAHVFEAAKQLRTDSGTIISVARNGMIGLDGLTPGLSKALQERGCAVESLKIVRMKHGEVVMANDRKQEGNLITVGWQAAQEVLAEKVKAEMVHCGHRFTSYTVLKDGVDAEFEVMSEDGGLPDKRVVRAQLLVGADGVRSAVRKQLVGDAPRFLRNLNWNAIVPNPDRSNFQGHELNQICFKREDGDGLSTFLVDAGRGYSFWQVRKWDTEEELSKTLGEKWGGFGKPGAKARVLEMLEGKAHWEDERKAIEATDESIIFERRIMDRLPIDKWSDDSGRVVLLGDAAHAMFPGPGEGARQAFEDAHQLVLALEEAFRSSEPEAIAAAVRRYEERRVKRCGRVQRFAAEGCGLPEEERMPPEVRKLPMEEQQKRWQEFKAWIESYPDKLDGDPDSTYWK